MAGMNLLIRVEDNDGSRLLKGATDQCGRPYVDVSQSGCLTLQKLQSRGQQHVIVQHQQVNVVHGGQEIVTGQLGGESRDGGPTEK
jgi:hypothetical protein